MSLCWTCLRHVQHPGQFSQPGVSHFDHILDLNRQLQVNRLLGLRQEWTTASCRILSTCAALQSRAGGHSSGREALGRRHVSLICSSRGTAWIQQIGMSVCCWRTCQMQTQTWIELLLLQLLLSVQPQHSSQA